MSSRFIIIDGSFDSISTHHYRYTIELRRVLIARAIPTAVFVSTQAKADLAAALGARRILVSSVYNSSRVQSDYRFLTQWLDSNQAVEQDLQTIGAIGLNETDVLLFHSTWSSQALGIFRWYLRLPPPRPRICLQFQGSHTSLAEPADHDLSYALFKKSLECWKQIPSGALICGATDAMSAYMTQMSGLRVSTLPTIIDTIPVQSKSARPARPVIGLIGSPRPEKGGVLIESLMNDRQVTARCELRYQKDTLSRAAYLDQLSACDAVMLPYRPEAYHLRASAVFGEAISAGCPVIVSPGGWMASELPKWGSPGVVAERYDAPAFAAAIDRVLARHEEFQARARLAAPRVQAFFSAENFIDTLLRHGFDRGPEPGRGLASDAAPR